MKRKLCIVFCAMAIGCISISGCSNSGSTASAGDESASGISSVEITSSVGSEDAATAAFVGTWDMVEITRDGTTMNKTAINAMKKAGGDYYVRFDEDGTFYMVSGDGTTVGAWDASSPTQGELAGSAGKTFSMSLEDGQLVLDLEKAIIKLEPGEARASLPSTSSAASSSSASKEAASSSASNKNASSAKYEVSIDDVAISQDYKGDPAIIVTFTWKNNSDESRSFMSALYPQCYQNGVQLSTAMVTDGIDNEGYLASVKPGYGTTLQMAYGLQDQSNDVEIEVRTMGNYKGEPLATKTYTF